MQKTIDQVVRGSELPVAIIIVGVGDADFSSMETLDGDDEALYSTAFRKYMSADIVQFVPYDEFKDNPHLLAKEVLDEIPGQLLNFMRRRNIAPYPRTAEQRRLIQQQLSMRPAAVGPGMIPPYFVQKREKFMQQLSQMGFEIFDMQDFLSNQGIWEAEVDTMMNVMNDPGYVNILKNASMQIVNPGLMPGGMVMQQPPMMAGQQPVGGM